MNLGYLPTTFVIAFFTIVHQISYASSEVTDKEYGLMPDIYQLDDYDKCLYHSLQDDPTFCRIIVQLYPENSKSTNKVWKIIQVVSSNDRKYRHDLLRHAICASSYCANYNGTLSECFNTSYSTKYKNLGLVGKLNDIQCEKKKSSHEKGTADVVVIVVLGIYLVFVILTTLILEFKKYRVRRDIIEQTEKKTSPVRDFLAIFSFVDNVRPLVIATGKTKSYMLFLQTIRFVSSVYFILLHAILLNSSGPVLNPQQLEWNTETLFIMILSKSGVFIQSFFIISLWLVGLSFFKKLKSEGKIGFEYVVKSIVRRYFRFAIGEIVLIALHATWFMHLSRGPMWEALMGSDYVMCRKKWWTNLLLFNNVGIETGICMMHTWYLAVDFQLTVLGLLILWLTQKKPRHLFLALGFLIAFQVIFFLVYLSWKNFEFGVVFTPELIYEGKNLRVEEWNVLWTTTYSSLAAVACGLLFGYLQTKHQNRNVFARNKLRILWWILIILLVVCVPLFSAYYMTTKYYSHSRWFAASYGSIEKVLFDLGFGFLLFGMAQGTGGVVKKLFEWTPMHILGQLSFGAYLIHFTFLKIDGGVRRTLYYVSDYSTMSTVVLNITLSYLCSILYTAVILTPIDRLLKKLV